MRGLLRFYILDDHAPVYFTDGQDAQKLVEWAKWLGGADGIVRETEIEVTPENRFTMKEKDLGLIKVSTAFFGFDKGDGEGDPLLFETQIVGGEMDGNCYRCST